MKSHDPTRSNLLSLIFVAFSALPAAAAQPPTNLFGNPSFEDGRDLWHMDRAGKTTAQFTVDDRDAAAGRHSALLTLGAAEEWGIQFGQILEAPAVGKTVTFSVWAKSVREPVTVRLEIERRAKPWDRAVASPPLTVGAKAWTELHATFKVEKEFREGWFAYVSCQQADAEFRLDMARLTEGEYVPYEQVQREELAAAAVSLWDRGEHSLAPLSSAALSARAGWSQVPEDATEHAFRGDAVMLNERLAVVFRRGAGGAELYGVDPRGFVLRSLLTPVGTDLAAKLESVSVVANDPGQVVVDATFQTVRGDKLTLRCELALGQVYVKTEPRPGVQGLRVQAPSRFLVLPDFFADDIVVDAANIPANSAEVPSENFLLHLLPDRQGIVMAVASNRGQDARIELDGQGADRQIRSSQLDYGKSGKIWVALLQGNHIWHQRDLAADEAGRKIDLEWTAPFPAQWRVDWRLPNQLTASWEMAAQLKNGEFLKYGWFGNPSTLPADRKRWTTVLGSFAYPCWLDQSGRGYLQPLSKPERFQGPTVIYPINRAKDTPLRDFTVVDLVRATLGVGPCEYILDVEKQGTTMKGRATCATRDALKAIYAAGQQQQRRAEIERILDEVVIFVKHIRGRIDQYIEFGHQTLAYLDEQKQLHPELTGALDELAASVRVLDTTMAKRQAAIKNPQYVVDLTEKFRQTLLDAHGDEALKQCTAITHAIVDVGGNQDELVGECRNAVKVLRQRAGLALAADPRLAPIAREIRQRTQQALRDATSYEAPRH